MSKRDLMIMAAILLWTWAPSARAQSLVRVVDPSNPVVTDLFESGGGSWIDLDDDEDLDLFVANGNLSSQDNSLYLNTGAGFVKVQTGNVVHDGGSSIGGTFGDFDEDGRSDLFVTNRNNFGNFLYTAAGETTFVKVTSGPPVEEIGNSNSSSWVDIDVDGDLDLYVVNFAGGDFLYRNDGAPAFSLASLTGTLPQIGNGPTIAGAWGDFDGDRDPDLFVGFAGAVNDVLYRNDGGFTFTATTIPDGRSTLGASWGDFDNDGDLDLVATNYLNQKCILYRNAGSPGFALVPDAGSVVSNTLGNSVGSGWGDYDNDGDLDLFVADDGQNNVLYANDGPPAYGFTRIFSGDAVNDGGNSFGCVWGDYDADGALDLFVANRLNQANFLYHNEGNGNHWAAVRLRGTVSNGSAIGARVFVSAVIGGASRRQMREVASQSGYNSGNLDLHFGLGDAAVVDTLRIEWPSGLTDVHRGVPVDRFLHFEEGVLVTGAAPPDETPRASTASIELVQQGWGPTAGLRMVLTHDVEGTLVLRDVSGSFVAELQRGLFRAGSRFIPIPRVESLASGVYFCTLHGAAADCTARVVLLR